MGPSYCFALTTVAESTGRMNARAARVMKDLILDCGVELKGIAATMMSRDDIKAYL
jgi:hypothetical protein